MDEERSDVANDEDFSQSIHSDDGELFALHAPGDATEDHEDYCGEEMRVRQG